MLGWIATRNPKRLAQTGSLVASSVEHSLYGDFVFTIGLGPYFFHGTMALLRATGGGGA